MEASAHALPLLDFGTALTLNQKEYEEYVKTEIGPALQQGICQVQFSQDETERMATNRAAAKAAIEEFFKLSKEQKLTCTQDIGMDIHEFFNLSIEKRVAYMDEYQKRTNQMPFESGFMPYGVRRSEDLKEMIQFGIGLSKTFNQKVVGASGNIWPDQYLPHFQEAVMTYYADLQSISRTTLSIIQTYLGLSGDILLANTSDSVNQSRILHYLPLSEAPAELQGDLTFASGHVDRGTVTVIYPEEGLQGLSPETDVYEPITATEGNHVIFTGAAMEIISDGIIPAKYHRVTPTEKTARDGRIAMPFFQNANGNFMFGGTERFPIPVTYHESCVMFGSQILAIQKTAAKLMGDNDSMATTLRSMWQQISQGEKLSTEMEARRVSILHEAAGQCYDPALRS